MEINELSIIGFGEFGKFFAEHLCKKTKVYVSDICEISTDLISSNMEITSIDEALKKEIIILAIPMRNLKDFLIRYGLEFNINSTVLDVCSLKIYPIDLMKKYLPSSCEIIGTHPLFGPKSGKNGIKNLNMVLCNVNSNNFDLFFDLFKSLELNVFEVTADYHDKQMALSQALTHFIGRSIDDMDLPKIDLRTKTFDDLMSIVDIISNDSVELFEDMQKLNPYSKLYRDNFISSVSKLDFDLKK